MKKKRKELLTLNTPIYVGCTVLALSKLEMYKFHYGFMKNSVSILVFLNYCIVILIALFMRLVKVFMK